jgi:hypothetical protein
MAQIQEPTPPQMPRHGDGDDIVRPRSTSQDRELDGNDNDNDSDDDARPGEDSAARKRRRSRKGLDKKFECPTEGCGKSYSRAEHL